MGDAGRTAPAHVGPAAWTIGPDPDRRRPVLKLETTVKAARRSDLDWIRVGALGLLMVYHVALVYAPWDWHVKSAHAQDWVQYAALASNPWRLTLLFLVSGAAVRLMARKLDAGSVLKARAARLLPPLAFGVLALVPIQSWIEANEKGWSGQGFVQWWLSEFSVRGLLDGVPLNHVWFVLYIAAYTLAAVALLARPKLLERIEAVLETHLRGWRLLVLPIAYLAVVRVLLFPWFGITNQLHVDWYNHAVSLGAFVFGFGVVGREAVWTALEAQRRRALAIALVALPVLIGLHLYKGPTWFDVNLRHLVYAVDQWAVICAVLGYGSRYIRKADGPALRYLTDAIFPCYLAHQTILVVAAYHLKRQPLPALVEATALLTVTFVGSLAVYEAVRRVDLLRPLWGLKRLPPKPATTALAPAAAQPEAA
jgi:glucans biosynthesis protein C